MKNKKPIIGIFGVSGCAGCLLTILYEDVFSELTKMLDIKSFPLIKENKYNGKYDLVFIEGTVVFDKDIIFLNEIREKSDVVIALGTCACLGGVPSITNFQDMKNTIRFIYPKFDHLRIEPPTPISNHIKVDYFIPQCPPNKEEIIDFVKCFIKKRQFRITKNPVCFECRKKGNFCLLEKGKICLGPITKGGCNAICPTNNTSCYGCRGPNKDANYKAFIDLLKSKGYSEEDLKEKIDIFAGLEFEEEIEKITKWLEK